MNERTHRTTSRLPRGVYRVYQGINPRVTLSGEWSPDRGIVIVHASYSNTHPAYVNRDVWFRGANGAWSKVGDRSKQTREAKP